MAAEQSEVETGGLMQRRRRYCGEQLILHCSDDDFALLHECNMEVMRADGRRCSWAAAIKSAWRLVSFCGAGVAADGNVHRSDSNAGHARI